MQNKNLPNGTRDEFGPQAQIKETIQNKLLSGFKNRGFQKLTTPVIEYSDVFKPLNPDDYRPYQMLDEQGETLVLRPDLTLPVARVMSATGLNLPVKWYYGGDVFRLKKRLSGSYNQLSQAGIEIVGYEGVRAEWECLSVALSECQRLGIPNVTLQLSEAGFVDAVISQLAIPQPTRESLKQALYAKDLSDYNRLCQPLVETEFSEFLREWPWLFGSFDQVMEVVKTLPDNESLKRMIHDLTTTQQFVNNQFPNYRVTVDLSIPSPQVYYTGMVFRGFTEQSADYLFSGGRYDDLLTNFQQVKVPAVGLAFEIDALVQRVPVPESGPQTLIYFDDEQWPQAEQLLHKLGNATLCLTHNFEAAKRLAASTNSKLLDLTKRR
ncbi:ATP phosphoribosyltransferase regulatory subunit [Lentilactobacillus diolivorans]|uniref:ATP phosphoribosyltransferase regulatory subunit n=2 Tax=Lentilactobacillus diolivorans TaxID=179838 RepID=A0A0R1S896_9LACO|nr:ATP phosphoribosyltransferase regulatory subunit [Lentilactobacillus diolivorans]KRL65702.1 ATP phosphoribosyltransferase for histidine biosynthesis [Lentilactobacillus diolivorans DSM 14421]GEP24378.1 ATP phosphoribosyltransferase regulatory subunit [Lentilactobacillus diolivorans]